MKDNVIVIPEDVWRNCQMSIARRFGKIRLNGQMYVIVDKRGHDLFECSVEADMTGRPYAIMPGEPADLCRESFVPIYRELGRDRFLQFLKDNPDVDGIKIAKQRLKKWQTQQTV